MSDGRGDDYIGKTEKVISGDIPMMHDGISWLDHKGQAGIIDCQILEGVYSLDQITDIIHKAQPPDKNKPFDVIKKRVLNHIAHLENTWNVKMAPHGFNVSRPLGGYVRFVFKGVPLQFKGIKVVSRTSSIGKSKIITKKTIAPQKVPTGSDVNWKEYLQRADQIFIHPKLTYSWEDIVTGVSVRTKGGMSKTMYAVGTNTFRGFHKINKDRPGAADIFKSFFIKEKISICSKLRMVNHYIELHTLENDICNDINGMLKNFKREMFLSYNKLRKPIDLYFEHIISMAKEMNEEREKLVSCLFLPLDSQMFANSTLFTDGDLKAYQVTRKSTYQDVRDEHTYCELQNIVRRKAEDITIKTGQAFNPIYFDLLWNDRYKSSGRNLFETNP